MASMLRYESGVGDEVVDLDCSKASVGTAAELRSREWSYELGRRGIRGAVRKAREASLEVKCTDMAELDRMRHVFERDVANGKPGELVAGEGWRTRAVFVSQEPSKIYRSFVAASLKAVLTDGIWRRGFTTQFIPTDGAGGAALDMPYDAPYDLSSPPPTSVLVAPKWAPSPIRLVIYGYAANPEVRIGGNVYAVDATVPNGGYMVIDGLDMTVKITDAHGVTSNAFASARRGSGPGCGEYVFERVPPGDFEVVWNKSFGFDLTVYEEEAEPPWS